MYSTVRMGAAGLVLLATVACDDDGGGPLGPSPEAVAGIYAVCSLDFDPEGDLLTTVNIIERGFETEDQQIRAPQLQVDVSRQFQILFTPKGQFVERSLLGTYTPIATRVQLGFTGGTAQAASFLLPQSLEVAFQETPKSLTTAATAIYDVARADYARLAGVSESGLADRIPGRMLAVFQAGGCG
jgi:hypothetical protein